MTELVISGSGSAPPFNLLALRNEVKARGFDEVADSRLNLWINRAYHRINDQEAWPFLQARATVTAPVAVDGLRAVLQAADAASGYPVTFEDIRTIRERGLPFMQGTPTSWYLDEQGRFAVWPEDPNRQIDLLYIGTAADLVDDTDTPIWPSRYNYILVDGACYYGYRDSDNLEAAADCAAEVDRGVGEMARALLVPNFDVARSIDSGPWATASIDW